MNVRVIPVRGDYRFFMDIATRWSDNDMFGHLNNVLYYRFFEAIVVKFSTETVNIDFMESRIIPYAAESLCRFHRPLSFPETVTGALKVEHLGKTSVRYGLALFGTDNDQAAASGHWVHVFVERDNPRPIAIPSEIKDRLEAMLQK